MRAARFSVAIEVGKTLLAGANFLLMATVLGPKSYGEYVILAAIAALGTQMFTVGFSQWVQPLASESGVRAAASTILPIIFFISLPFLAVGTALASTFVQFDLELTFLVLATEGWVFPLWTSLAVALLATRRLVLYAVFALAIPAVKLGMTAIILVGFEGNLLEWAKAVGGIGLLGLAITTFVVSGGRLLWTSRYFTRWLRRGVSFSTVGLASAASENLDRVIVAAMLGTTSVAAYGVGARFSSYGTVPVKGLALVNYSVYFRCVADEEFDKLGRTVRRAAIVGVFTGAVVGLVIVLGAILFADRVFGDYEGLKWVAIALTIAIPARAIQYACGDALYALGLARARLLITLLGAGVTVLCTLLGSQFGGLLGAAMGVSVSSVLIAFLLALQLKRTIDLSTGTET